MPHLIIEYSSNLTEFNAEKTLAELNKVILDLGEFAELALKSRTIKLDNFLIGRGATKDGFIYAKLAILSGRSIEFRKQLSEQIVSSLQSMAPWREGTQLCAEILEIEAESYTKRTI
jgi:5-carboxymethyl-2-hydroxymuconate isomerase